MIFVKEGSEGLEETEVLFDYNGTVSQSEQESCTYELKLVVTACIRLVQAQGRQNTSIEGKGEQKIAPLGEELFCGREN